MDWLQQLMNTGSEILDFEVGPSAGKDAQGPLGLPQASINEMERTRTEVIDPLQDELAEAITPEGFYDDTPTPLGQVWEMEMDSLPPEPITMGVNTYELGQEPPLGQAPPTLGLPPEFSGEPQTDANGIPKIENREDVLAAYNQSIAQEAENQAQYALDLYNGGKDNSQQQEFDFFSMVEGVAKTLGDGLSFGYEQWMKLSPSTRTALVGAAATAFSYAKGWRKTAGDVAYAFGNMYNQQQMNEEATRRQVLSDNTAIGKATKEGQNKAVEEAKKLAIKSADSEAVKIVSNSDAMKKLMQTPGFLKLYNKTIDDSDRPMLTQQLADIYTTLISQGKLDHSVKFSQWVANPSVVEAGIKQSGLDFS